jgi:hypothetical protein
VSAVPSAPRRRVLTGPLILAVVLAAGLMLAPRALAAKPAPTPGPTVTNSRGPLLWTVPGGVDTAPIDGIACPATSLCVAVDRAGGVLWSTDPAGGPGQWHRADVDGANELTGISCPSASLCVAVDGGGNAVTSVAPTAGGAAWTVARVDTSSTQNNTDNAGAVLVRGVSCPSTTLCVAVDAAGNAVVSTDPTGGAAAWGTIHVDTNTAYHCSGTGLTCQPPLVGISCPSVARCVAVDFSGNVLSSAAPTAVAPWATTPTDGGSLSSLWGVSCPGTGFCATVDGTAGRVITLNPAAPAAQMSRSLPYSLDGIWCQSPSLCLASVQTPGAISGLLGSFDPAARGSTWSLSSLGGVNAVACPVGSPVCLAADDEGNIAAGETTKAITSAVNGELLAARKLPTIAALDRKRSATLSFTSLIAGQVKLAWTVPGTGATPVSIATVTHRFAVPGTAKLTLRLTAAGRRLFRAAARTVRLTGTARFTASTGVTFSTKQLTFRHPPKP